MAVSALSGQVLLHRLPALLAIVDRELEAWGRAGSRDLFAAGAIRAAKWLVGKPPGAYTMDDIMDDIMGDVMGDVMGNMMGNMMDDMTGDLRPAK